MTGVVTDGESNFSRDFSMEIMLLWLYFLVVTRCLLLHPGCYVIVGKWLMVDVMVYMQLYRKWYFIHSERSIMAAIFDGLYVKRSCWLGSVYGLSPQKG